MRSNGDQVGYLQLVVDVPAAFAATKLNTLLYSVLSEPTGKPVLSGEIMALEAPAIVGTTVSLAPGEQDMIMLTASTSAVICFADSLAFSVLADQATRVNMTVQCVDYPGPASSRPISNGMVVDAGIP